MRVFALKMRSRSSSIGCWRMWEGRGPLAAGRRPVPLPNAAVVVWPTWTLTLAQGLRPGLATFPMVTAAQWTPPLA